LCGTWRLRGRGRRHRHGCDCCASWWNEVKSEVTRRPGYYIRQGLMSFRSLIWSSSIRFRIHYRTKSPSPCCTRGISVFVSNPFSRSQVLISFPSPLSSVFFLRLQFQPILIFTVKQKKKVGKYELWRPELGYIPRGNAR
jgi:hypothetical protein